MEGHTRPNAEERTRKGRASHLPSPPVSVVSRGRITTVCVRNSAIASCVPVSPWSGRRVTSRVRHRNRASAFFYAFIPRNRYDPRRGLIHLSRRIVTSRDIKTKQSPRVWFKEGKCYDLDERDLPRGGHGKVSRRAYIKGEEHLANTKYEHS